MVEAVARKRRIVEGMPSKKRIAARMRMATPTREPTPIAWRKLRTYPSSMANIPAKHAIGMLSVAKNMAT